MVCWCYPCEYNTDNKKELNKHKATLGHILIIRKRSHCCLFSTKLFYNELLSKQMNVYNKRQQHY